MLGCLLHQKHMLHGFGFGLTNSVYFRLLRRRFGSYFVDPFCLLKGRLEELRLTFISPSA